MKTPLLPRRQFLARTGRLAAAVVAGPNLLLHGQNTAGRRLNIAVIGALGKGQGDTRSVANDHNIVALVDVDRNRLESAVQEHLKATRESNPNVRPPRLFADFRRLFDEMASDIDAVIISTPDHTHFVAAVWALRHKKPICVQKPLCNTLWEARELHRLARAAGVTTQMGNQGRTSEGHRLAREWVDQGFIGTLREIRLWTNRPIWPQGPMTKKPVSCPAHLDWDLWLSSEREEPYFEFDVPAGQRSRRGNSVHPFNWRGWWQFGSGALGDMGCHIMDATFNVLGRRLPEKIEVESSPVTELTAPAWSRLVYHFAAAGTQPALKVTWFDGTKDGQVNKPECDERVLREEYDRNTSGMMFIGSEGAILADTYCNRPMLYPESKDDEVRQMIRNGTYRKTEPRSPHPGNPQLEWASAIVDGGSTSSSFDYAAPLTEFVLLGNLAIRSGEMIQWDTDRLEVTNVPAANRFVKRPAYRPGWT